jgi:hypothetical protein
VLVAGFVDTVLAFFGRYDILLYSRFDVDLSRQEKLEIMKSLNWDYTTSPEEMLDVLEGKIPVAGTFDADMLFVRSLERLPWHYVIALWGVEGVKARYTPNIARRIWNKDLRRKYEFALAILRREPVSLAEWGSPHHKQLQDAFLSHRWNRTQ